MGVYSNNITKADIDMKNLTYTVEKKPSMWWIEFERILSLSYQTYVKHERGAVHSDQMNIRALLEKVTCDWIGKIKSYIKVRPSDRPMTYTFYKVMQALKT